MFSASAEEELKMLVRFNTKNAAVGDKELSAMESKIDRRLHRYFSDKDTEVFVKFSEKKLEYKVEITLTYLGIQLRSETKDKVGFSASLDKGLDTMERQITKCKGKLESRYQTADEILPDVEAEPSEYSVVRTKEYEAKPMTTQEAILSMNMLGHTFYTFYCSDYNKICTVYKRDDGDYGLILLK